MQLTKKEKTIKYVIYCGIIALFSLIQNVDGLWFEIGSARCLFLIPLCVLLSVGEDEKTAPLLGLFSGVLWDIIGANHTAFNAVFLTIACYVTSVFITHLLRDTYWVGVVIGCVFTLLYVLVYWIVYVATQKNGAVSIFFEFYFSSFLYTSIACLVMNLFVVKLRAKLNKE